MTADVTFADWMIAAAVFGAAIALGRVAQGLVVGLVHGDGADRGAAVALGRFLALVFAAGGLVYSLAVLEVRIGPLLGALGIGGLALALAGQTILANFLGSITLQVRRPFHRGDEITTNDCEGTVEDVNFRAVVLRTFDGEQVLVPCSQVLGSVITNHTRPGRRRTTVSVAISYGADLQEARRVLLQAAVGLDDVLDRPVPEVWVEEFADSGVTLAIRFWHAPDVATLWRARSAVVVAAKRALDEAGIEIPFPQRVLRFPRQVLAGSRPVAPDSGEAPNGASRGTSASHTRDAD